MYGQTHLAAPIHSCRIRGQHEAQRNSNHCQRTHRRHLCICLDDWVSNYLHSMRTKRSGMGAPQLRPTTLCCGEPIHSCWYILNNILNCASSERFRLVWMPNGHAPCCLCKAHSSVVLSFALRMWSGLSRRPAKQFTVWWQIRAALLLCCGRCPGSSLRTAVQQGYRIPHNSDAMHHQNTFKLARKAAHSRPRVTRGKFAHAA